MKIQTILKYLPLAGFSFAFGNTINAHLTSLETKRRIDTLQKSLDQNSQLNNEIRKSLESLNQEREMLFTNLNQLNENHQQIQSSLNKIEENNTLNVENISKSTDLLKDLNKSYETFLEFISEIGGSDKTNFTIDTNLLDSLNNYISTLTPLETLSVLHICGSLVILFSLFSILSVFYGEFFIQKFSIENKFPKLAKFIQIRRKYQQFYLLTQFLLIFVILILSTIVDVLYLPSILN